MNPVQHILIFGIRIYQRLFSPVLGTLFGPDAGCRYTPTCSEYAAQAVQRHGAFHGAWLATKRIARCQPWGGCGHDPVPECPDHARISPLPLKSAPHGS